VPRSLPEPFKTNAVLEAEYRNLPRESLNSYINAWRDIPFHELNGAILIDEQSMFNVMNSQGIYKGLSQRDTQEQLDLLIRFNSENFPRLQIKVVHFLDYQISSCLMVGGSLVANEFFNFIVKTDDQIFISLLQTRLNAAFRYGLDLQEWKDAHL
jgi:hypothetical protein